MRKELIQISKFKMHNDNSKLKILVTGAKGQLGKKIIEVMEPEYDLILTDAAEMDITNAAKVNEVIGQEKPDFIIHGAAYTQVDKAEENEELCRRVNVLGSENIAKAAKANDATVIYISTDYVFDGKKQAPYVETDRPYPLSVYGQTKYEGELAVQSVYKNTSQVNAPKHLRGGYYIIRSAWIFGELPESHPGTNFVEMMLRLAKERDELFIVDDQVGSPTYTGDLVDAIDHIIFRCCHSEPMKLGGEESLKKRSFASYTQDDKGILPSGFYHFSGTGACSWYDFACEIFKQAAILHLQGVGTPSTLKVIPITSDQYPQKAKRPAYSYLDKSKIEAALNIKVRPWQEMLREYLEKRR